VNFWVFSSSTLANVRTAKDRLLWGFWDREAGEKQRRNWRTFIRAYNRIRPFDVAVFQIARTGDIHALGIIRETYYDDQTPIWPLEIEENRVLYPWRVSFSAIIFSEEPFVSHFVRIQDYVDGYGIGVLEEHEFRRIFDNLKQRINVAINIS